MKRPRITPDKWEHRGYRVFRKNSYEIAYISQQGAHHEWDANGKAIASLPDLLEALEFYANQENWKVQHSGIGEFPSEAESDGGSQAIAALTKAGYTF